MRSFSTVIASIALILSAWQAYLSWNARDDHLEVIATERILVACAEVGLASAEYAALMEPNLQRVVAGGRVDPAVWGPLLDGRRILRKAYFVGTYVLGPDYAEELDAMRDNGEQFPIDVSDFEAENAQARFDAFAEAGQSIQARCRGAAGQS